MLREFLIKRGYVDISPGDSTDDIAMRTIEYLEALKTLEGRKGYL